MGKKQKTKLTWNQYRRIYQQLRPRAIVKRHAYMIAFLLPVLAAVSWLFPAIFPLGLFQVWVPQGHPVQWLLASLPLFVWGVSVATARSILTRNPRWYNLRAEAFLKEGMARSTLVGVFEEVKYRWLFFFFGIIANIVFNFLFFGFAGFGLVEWLYTAVFGPLANWITLGLLHDIFFHPAGWVFGAAVLSANAKFRDGHKYQGVVGWINSWFVGIYFFWLMFTFGLLAAIGAHILYNLLVHGVRYVDAILERRSRRPKRQAKKLKSLVRIK